MSEKQAVTEERLKVAKTELGELGEAVQTAMDRTFEEEYDVVNVSVDEESGLIVVSMNILPDEDVDQDEAAA